jgi:hypothetical protein
MEVCEVQQRQTARASPLAHPVTQITTRCANKFHNKVKQSNAAPADSDIECDMCAEGGNCRAALFFRRDNSVQPWSYSEHVCKRERCTGIA